MGLVLDVAGSLHVYGLTDAKGVNREIITATMLLVVAGLWLLLRPDTNEMEDRGPPVWLALLPAVAAMISISDFMSYVSTGWTSIRVVFFSAMTLALLLLAIRRAPALWIAAVALASGVILRYANIRHIPIEPARGDMLPLVQGALANLLAGRDPYMTYAMPWEVPLTYLPLTWLAYAPAYLSGIDIRWTNVVAEVAVLGAVVFVARQAGARRETAANFALLLWSWLFLSPTVTHWDLATSAPISWAAIAWTLALVITSRHELAALVLGLAAATTPLIVVFGPLIALCWWRAAGLFGMARRLLIAGIVVAALVLPWLLWGPAPFLDGTVRWFNDLSRYPRTKWQADHSWREITGFSGLFWEWGLETWLKPIQAGLIACVTAVFALRGARLTDLGRHATATFLLFMLFNPVLWPYYYNPALVTALLAIGGASVLEPMPAARAVRWAPNKHLRRARNPSSSL
jgi:hypothetical protein